MSDEHLLIRRPGDFLGDVGRGVLRNFVIRDVARITDQMAESRVRSLVDSRGRSLRDDGMVGKTVTIRIPQRFKATEPTA